MVIISSLAGCRLSLNRACRKAEAAFFDSSLLQADGYYTCPGDQLEHCADYANRLLSVIGSDGEWAETYEALRAARSGLIDALEQKDIPAISTANQALAEAVADVQALKDAGAPLPDSHDDYDAIVSDFQSAQALLDDPAYSEHILAFQDKELGAFPANILRRLLGVRTPETFP